MKNKKLKPYETDASQIEGKSLEVEQPETIEGVQRVIRMNKQICIRGGGSGLVGGAVPLKGVDIVLDVSKLDKIISLNKERKIVEVEAGIILDELQDYLEEFSLEFPINPSSHAIATIGGMIATNAVGSRAIMYGKTSEWVSWVDVVNGAGKLERKTQTELSDYSGMEGITGVIVRAGLKLSSKKIRSADFIEFKTIDELIRVAIELKRDSSVSMIEYFDDKLSGWLDREEKFHLLVERESEKGKFRDGRYSEIMKLRDKVYPLLAEKEFSVIEDPKVLISKSGRLLQFLKEKKIPCFGHLSVGILHPCFRKGQEEKIKEMMKLVKMLGGSVSGEHGIGLLKREFVDVNDKKILINIKKRTDCRNKFNVGKVI